MLKSFRKGIENSSRFSISLERMLKSFREDFRKFSRFSIFFRENAEEFLCVSVAENKPSYIPSGSLEGGNVGASQGASSALKLCISYFLITSSVHAHQCCITQLLYLRFLGSAKADMRASIYQSD